MRKGVEREGECLSVMNNISCLSGCCPIGRRDGALAKTPSVQRRSRPESTMNPTLYPICLQSRRIRAPGAQDMLS